MNAHSSMTIRKRAASIFLSVVMIVASVFTSFTSVPVRAGAFGMYGFGAFTDVNSNNKIEFRNSAGQVISEVDTGEDFTMHVELSGSNVYQFGFGTTYMIELTNDNIQLTDFAGNGTKNGAKYAGFTISIVGGKRYLMYTVTNGQTRALDLNLRFKNGTTPDDTKVTATLSTMGSFTSKKATVTANADIKWANTKSASPTAIDIGTPVTYTVKAYPDNTSDTGVWYAGKVKVTDTIELPSGLSFTDTPTITVNGSPATIVSSDSSSVTFTYEAESSNKKGEMSPQEFTVTLNTSTLSGSSGGTFTNTVTTDVWGVGNESSSTPDFTTSPASADVSISEPTPADVNLSKDVKSRTGEYVSKGFLTDGDTAVFTITLSNNGDSPEEYEAGKLVLTDVLPEGLVYKSASAEGYTVTQSGKTVTFTNDSKVTLTKGKVITFDVECTVEGATETLKSLVNTSYLGTADNYTKMATALVSVKKPGKDYSVSKSVDKSVYTPGDTLTYTVVITNTGEDTLKEADFGSVSDSLNSSLSISDFNIPADGLSSGESVSATYSIAAGTDDITTNTVKVGDKSATATSEKSQFSLGNGDFSKRADSTVTQAGGTISYTFKYFNNSRFGGTVTGLEFGEITVPAQLNKTGIVVKVGDTTLETGNNEVNGDNYNLSSDANNLPLVKFSGDVGAYETIAVTYVFTVNDTKGEEKTDGEGNSLGEFVGYNVGQIGGKEVTADQDIKISKISFEVDKYAYSEGTGTNIPDKAADRAALLGYDTSELTKIDYPVVSSGTYGTVEPGQLMTYYIKITNTGAEPITRLKLTDQMIGIHQLDTAVKVYLVDKSENVTAKFGNDRTDDNADGITEDSPVATFWAAQYDSETQPGGGTAYMGFYEDEYGWKDGQDGQYLGRKNTSGDNNQALYVLNIPKGEYIVLAYQIHLGDGVYGFDKGTNTAIVEANEEVSVSDDIQYRVQQPIIEVTKGAKFDPWICSDDVQTIEPVMTDGKFDFDKTYEALKDMQFRWYLEIANYSKSNEAYTEDLTITDTIPEGMELYVEEIGLTVVHHEWGDATTPYGSTETYPTLYNIRGRVENTLLYDDPQIKKEIGNTGSGEYNTSRLNYVVNGNEVTFSPAYVKKNSTNDGVDTLPLKWRFQTDSNGNVGTLVYSYVTKLTDKKAAAIAAELGSYVANGNKDYQISASTFDNSYTLKSVNEYLEYNNGTVNATKQSTADSTLILKPSENKPSPGLTKTADPEIFSGYVDDVDTGFPTFPQWQIVVSNTATGTDDGKMSGIKVEDSLSDNMQWLPSDQMDFDNYDDEDEKEKFQAAANGYKIVDISNLSNAKSDIEGWQAIGTDVTIESTPGKVTIEYKGELEPGKALIVNFATYKPGEESKDKSYSDKALLSCDETIDKDRVTNGTYVGGKVEATAQNGIGGVETTSYKTIQTFGEDGIALNDHSDSSDAYESSNMSSGLPQGNNFKEGDITDHYAQGNWSGTKSADNYVTGLQGKKVQYTINVQNDATDRDLHDFVVIDRLPFEMADPGIISGYNRYSAFSVYLNSTSFDVYVDGELKNDVLKRVDYSTDMTAVIDETASDWDGESSGAMNWKELTGDVDLTTVRDLRFVFADGFIVGRKGSENNSIRIVINAIIPEYVANTGEENIAWNSFAYGYNYYLTLKKRVDGKMTYTVQDGTNGTEAVMSDEPMVAEPAKVGVWVPDVENPLTLEITKDYISNKGDTQTFYFTLYKGTSADEAEKFGETKKLEVTDKSSAKLTMDGISSALGTGESYFLFETDSVGNKLTSDSSDYTIIMGDGAEFNNGQKLEFTDSKAAVNVKNKITLGSIKAEKTFKSVFETTDTFYLALFTKNGEDYELYSKDQIKAVTVTGSEEGATEEVEFKDLPTTKDFYILETDKNGEPVDDSYKYEVTYGDNAGKDNSVKAKATDPDTAPVTAKVTNEEKAEAAITVKKTSDDMQLNGDSIKFGLFEAVADGEKYKAGDKVDDLTLTLEKSGDTVTGSAAFDPSKIDADKQYIVLELDAEGNILNQDDTDENGNTVNYNSFDSKDGETYYYIPVEFVTDSAEDNTTDAESDEKSVPVPEDYKKTVPVLDKAPAKPANGQITVTKEVLVDGASSDDWESFYVGLYTIGEGENAEPELAGTADKFVKEVTPENPTVTFDGVVVKATEDDTSDSRTYYVAECKSDGSFIGDSDYTIVNSFGGVYSSASAEPEYSETSNSMVAVELDASTGALYGFVKISNTTNTIERYIAKVGDDKPLGGAELIIRTETDYASYLNDINDETKSDEDKAAAKTQFELPDNATAATTTVKDKDWDITKVDLQPNVTYVLVETKAPAGYNIADPIKFAVDKDGYLVFIADDSEDTREPVTNDTTEKKSVLTMTDTKKSGAELTISKVDIADETAAEVPGAEMKLTAVSLTDETESVDLSGVTKAEGSGSTDDGFTASTASVTWTSSDKAVVLNALPDGKYTLEETAAPDGYTKVTEFTFTIENGKVEKAETTREDVTLDEATDETAAKITVSDTATVVKISKYELGKEAEVAGAQLTITRTGINEADEAEVDTKLDSTKIKVTSGETTLEEGDYVVDGSSITFTSQDKATEITGLPDGYYTLKEVNAPDGFTKVESSWTFKIEDGVVTTEGTADDTTKSYIGVDSEDSNHIIVNDAINTVTISKQDVGGSEIAGAELIIYKYSDDTFATKSDFKEAEISKLTITRGTDDLSGSMTDDGGLTFAKTEAGKSTVIEGLADGYYVLHEEAAPDGYAVATDIKFQIADGVVKLIEATTDGNTFKDAADNKIIMTDEKLGEVVISKVDAATGKEIDGAELSIDKVGDVVKNDDGSYKYTKGTVTNVTNYKTAYETVTSVVTDENDNTVTAEDGSTVTTVVTDSENNVVTTVNAKSFKLKDGVYKLTETISPDGYTVAEAIYFVVSDGKVIYNSKTEPSESITAEQINDNKVVMKDQPTMASISKVEAGKSEELAGAVLTITADNKNADLSKVYLKRGEDILKAGEDYEITANAIKFTSADTATVIYALPDGEYTLTEDTAPLGYKVNSEPVEFTIDKGDVKKSDVGAVIEDELIKVTFSKKSMTGEDEIKGAEITITSLDGKVLNGVTAKQGETDVLVAGENDTSFSFTSGETETIFSGLPAGMYRMVETRKPDGYEKIEEKAEIKFKVETDGTVAIIEDADGDGHVTASESSIVMKDDATIGIGKFDAADSKELKGATLTLTGKNDEEDITFDISNVTLGTGAELITKENGTALEWKSGTTDTLIKNLPDGTYTLKETADDDSKLVVLTDADGNTAEYKVLDSEFTFEVKNGIITTAADTEGYHVADTNTIKVNDARNERTLVINKVEAAGENETVQIAGAEFVLTNSGMKSADWEALIGLNGDKLTAVKDESGNITGVKFTSSTADDMIYGLADGTYELEEKVAPDGYVVATKFTFKVTGGEVESAGFATTGETSGTITASGKTTLLITDDISEISIDKRDITRKTEVAGATLTLTGKNGDKDIIFDISNVTLGEGAELVTKENGTTLEWKSGSSAVTIKGLPDGDYVLTETAGSDTKLFKAEDGNTYTIVDQETKFTIENGVIVKDTFDKFDENAEKSYTAITSETEIVVCDAKASSTAKISKKSAAEGDNDEIAGAKMTITSDKALTEDEIAKIKLTRGEGDKKVTLTEGEDYTIETAGETTVIKFTSADVSTDIEGLPAGTYTLKEVSAPEGYELYTESVNFSVIERDGGLAVDGTQEIVDKPIKVTIDKRDVTGQTEVKDAVLTLTNDKLSADDWKNLATKNDFLTLTKDEDGNANGVTWTSDGEAKTISYLKNGTYTLAESQAEGTEIKDADGNVYEVLESTVTFEVDNTKENAVTSAGAKTKADNEAGYVFDDATDTLLVCDAQRARKASISKQDAVTGEELAGAEITITSLDGKSMDNVKAVRENAEGIEEEVTLTKSEDGKSVTFTSGEQPTRLVGLEAGEYKLKETTAPDGYQKTESAKFTIDADGKATGTTTMKDAQSVTIKKSDMGGKELAGAEITFSKLKVTEDGKTEVEYVVDSWTSTNEAHTIISNNNKDKTDDSYNAQLEDGYYLLHEEAAPAGYTVITDIYVEIKGGIVSGLYDVDSTGKLVKSERTDVEAIGQNITITDELTEVKISKQDVTNGGKQLEGATLVIESASGSDLSGVTAKDTDNAEVTLKHDGKTKISYETGEKDIVLSAIPAGEYTLTEITAPDGYAKAETITFTVNADGTIKIGDAEAEDKTIVMEDKVITASISKRAAASGNEIEGALLTVELNSDDEGVTLENVEVSGGATSVTRNEKSISFRSGTQDTILSKLPAGEYTLTETRAPDGYEKAEFITFNVDEFGNITGSTVEGGTVVMLDDSTIEISKVDVDSENNEELEGAKLTLTAPEGVKLTAENGSGVSEDGSQISWISGKNAKTIKNLPDGEYTLKEEGFEGEGEYQVIESTITFTIKDGLITETKKVEDVTGGTIEITDSNTIVVSNAKKQVVTTETDTTTSTTTTTTTTTTSTSTTEADTTTSTTATSTSTTKATTTSTTATSTSTTKATTTSTTATSTSTTKATTTTTTATSTSTTKATTTTTTATSTSTTKATTTTTTATSTSTTKATTT
ncbi:MAG: DUF11 domain-containing protein, partial [Ruminococcus sp.]|nr:DUF11 domain-containing protein [Ruminococcus sp.]